MQLKREKKRLLRSERRKEKKERKLRDVRKSKWKKKRQFIPREFKSYWECQFKVYLKLRPKDKRQSSKRMN